jgi:hypothetical protein
MCTDNLRGTSRGSHNQNTPSPPQMKPGRILCRTRTKVGCHCQRLQRRHYCPRQQQQGPAAKKVAAASKVDPEPQTTGPRPGQDRSCRADRSPHTRKSRLPGVGTRPASAAPDPQHHGEVPARPRRCPRTLWEPRRRCRGNRASRKMRSEYPCHARLAGGIGAALLRIENRTPVRLYLHVGSSQQAASSQAEVATVDCRGLLPSRLSS